MQDPSGAEQIMWARSLVTGPTVSVTDQGTLYSTQRSTSRAVARRAESLPFRMATETARYDARRSVDHLRSVRQPVAPRTGRGCLVRTGGNPCGDGPGLDLGPSQTHPLPDGADA